jgi:Kef-type K+ transport system membrane component KefB
VNPEQAWTLVVVSLGAFIVPLLCRWVHLSAAAGEALYGVLVGPSGLGLVNADDYLLILLGGLGFVLLMFLAGLEIDFNHMITLGSRSTLLAMMVVGLGFALSFLIASLFGWPPMIALFMACISLGLPLTVLRETGSGNTPLEQVILLVGSAGEFVTIVIFTILTVTTQAGGGAALTLRLIQLATLFLITYVLLRIFILLVWWRPELFEQLAEKGDPQEIGMRLAMFIMLLFVGLASLLHVKLVLGAFLAGAVLSFTFRESTPIVEKISNIGFGFLVPIFFIQVGIGFAPANLSSQGMLRTLPLFFVLIVAIKLLPSLLLTRIGLSPREAIQTGLLLACPLTLMVAIAEVAENLGIVDKNMQQVLILIALILSITMPLTFKLLDHSRS